MKKYDDIKFAKIDTERVQRRGYSEVVYCECKTSDELVKIFETFLKNGQNVLGSRASKEQFLELKKVFPNVEYSEKSRILKLIQKPAEKIGEIAICTGGTGDIPVAEEAAETAEFYGSNIKRYYDVGIAGLQRLLDNIEDIKKANVIIAVAGMEGALGGVITGLTDVPVIAVPTSVGYGTSLNGISALLTMLNSCAEGMTVVNIDNGFGAGYTANLINRKIENGKG
ncbi:MAG: nickel pincer cofactor biosynthesis protein LarB [Candidatus Gastranaerophilales bacterium]|nr:nickel pincer cofactor biosynthesis protein LarB [Candidatus Gastranaerophilales bacterium]